jgi:integrase/recombinase XerD
VTQLRKRMLEELQRRNYSQPTIESYLHAVGDFARHFGKSPDQLNQEHVRQYQLHLVHDRKLAVNTIVGRISALRFFFVKTLRRPYQCEDLPSPKRPKKLPASFKSRYRKCLGPIFASSPLPYPASTLPINANDFLGACVKTG